MEPVADMPTEIVLLGWSVVLLLVQLMLQNMAAISEHGLGYALTARDEDRRLEGLVAGRLTRGYYNLLETFPAFAALALALAVTERTGGLAAVGAHLWFWARVVYVPVYASGVLVLRTVIWWVSVVGIVLMLIPLLV